MQTWKREVAKDETRSEEFEEQYSSGAALQGTSGAVSQDTTGVLSQDAPIRNDRNQKKNKIRCKTRYWGHSNILVLMNFWNQGKVIFNVKLPKYMDKDSRNNSIE